MGRVFFFGTGITRRFLGFFGFVVVVASVCECRFVGEDRMRG